MQISSFNLYAFLSIALATAKAEKPFIQQVSNSSEWIIGNDLWNITIGETYGTKLFYKDHDLIGDAVGHYAGYDGESNFRWTSASIYSENSDYLDVVFSADEIDLHWVLLEDLAGAYQYIVNKKLPTLGVLRTLFRLDNTTFTHGRTNIKDDLLPQYADILAATNVQDETWQRADGTFITKYDWSAFIRDLDFHGVYGEEFGSWYIRPGRDYFNGNHLKQELTVHRESKTGDAVELNVVHGSHFQVTSRASFPVGKTWGPWLWYLNDGSKDDATSRAKQEFASWPYPWLNLSDYNSRGEITGQLLLSDGRPASGASIFLGDSNSNISTLDQGTTYQYTTTADSSGKFTIRNVRTATYGLYAWSNGGSISDVTTTFTQNDILVTKNSTTALRNLIWQIPKRKAIFQVGDLDHKSLGFHNGGSPYQHGLVAQSPANLTYIIGESNTSDWFFGQSALGTWRVIFDVSASDVVADKSALLTISLAGYSKGASLAVGVNGYSVANLTTAVVPTDPALYRSGTTAGEWHLYEFEVEAGVVRSGRNSVDFTITAFTLWRGFLWDSIVLEWA